MVIVSIFINCIVIVWIAIWCTEIIHSLNKPKECYVLLRTTHFLSSHLEVVASYVIHLRFIMYAYSLTQFMNKYTSVFRSLLSVSVVNQCLLYRIVMVVVGWWILIDLDLVHHPPIKIANCFLCTAVMIIFIVK